MQTLIKDCAKQREREKSGRGQREREREESRVINLQCLQRARAYRAREGEREQRERQRELLACYKGTSSTSNKATLNVTSCPNKICNFNATTVRGSRGRRGQSEEACEKAGGGSLGWA